MSCSNKSFVSQTFFILIAVLNNILEKKHSNVADCDPMSRSRRSSIKEIISSFMPGTNRDVDGERLPKKSAGVEDSCSSIYLSS